MFITVTRDVKKGVHEVNGWANSAYGMSKVGVTVMTPLQQAELDADKTRSILVNCVSVSIRITCTLVYTCKKCIYVDNQM